MQIFDICSQFFPLLIINRLNADKHLLIKWIQELYMCVSSFYYINQTFFFLVPTNNLGQIPHFVLGVFKPTFSTSLVFFLSGTEKMDGMYLHSLLYLSDRRIVLTFQSFFVFF